jgi:hypothetical protein
MRAIPVGTAGIAGSVTYADGGRPARDVRVQLAGAATIPESAMPGGGSPVVLSGGSSMSSGRAVGGGPGNGLSLVRTTMTDAAGRYAFAKLPAGHFTLSFSKNNFLTASYGQKRPGAPGTTIVIDEGQQITANAALLRGGVISGTIYGADGEPLARAQVGAWRYAMNGGTRRLQQNNGTSTDDRGTYRLTNLQPGDYLVSATPNASDAQMAARMNPDASAIEQAIASGKVQPPAAPGFPSTVLVPVPQPQQGPMLMNTLAYLPTYHPGTPVPSSGQVIHITGGDEHVADITVQYTEAGSIQGTVATPIKPGVMLRLSLSNNDPSIETFHGTSLDGTGKFTFRALAPGTYTVMAQTAPSPQQNNISVVNGVVIGNNGPPPQLGAEDRLWGSAVATVDGGTPTVVSISLHPGRSISGIVVFDMAKPPDLARGRLMVSLQTNGPTMGPQPQAAIESDGRFTLAGVAPGKYTLRVNGGGPLKSSMVGSVDTLDFPLEFTATDDIGDAVITLTDKASELSGVVTESNGKPGMDYTIIAASTDERFWTPNSRRISMARTGVDGKYTFRGLPPGDYNVVVVTDFEQGAQYDPEFLRALNGAATRVRVIDAGKVTQDLRVK